MEKRKIILSVVGVVGVVTASYMGYQFVMYSSTDNAQVEAHAVMLAPKVAGFITKVNVVEGQKVKKNDVLAEIDERDFQNTLRQIQGDTASVQARMHDADTNFHRLGSLYKSGSIAQQQYDTASANYNDVKAKFEAVNAQVEQAKLNLINTKITAPSEGYIAKKSVEVGQLASPGVPLFGFVSAEERWVTANFKETDLEDIKVGANVLISVDAIAAHQFHGKVESISAATGATFTLLPPDNATGNFTKVVQRVPVKIALENLSADDIDHLRAGLSAVVKVKK